MSSINTDDQADFDKNKDDDFVLKTEREIKKELVDLTVVDDSDESKPQPAAASSEIVAVSKVKAQAKSPEGKETVGVSKVNEIKQKVKAQMKSPEGKETVAVSKVKAPAKSPEGKSLPVEHDSLILTADDEMFSVVSNDKDSPKKTEKSNNRNEQQKKSRAHSSDSSSKSTNRSLWVSNISKSLKASNLKQHFSKYGKIVTAKVVTDGKNFYGYLSFEKREDAERCMKKLDGTVFEDRKLKISFSRPNHQESASKQKKVDESDPLTTRFNTTKTTREKQLERDYLRERREAERLKRKMLEQEERNRVERQRQKKREQEQRELEWKLKMQRKQLQIEREMFEKERKEVIRLAEERRRIEEERLEIMKEKAKLKEELRGARKSESKKRCDGDKEDEKRHKLDVKSKICDKRKSEDRYGGRYRKESPRAPPPPKLSEVPKSGKGSRSYEDLKKSERDYRKIETIHRERRPEGRKERFFQRNGGFGQQEPWKQPWDLNRFEQNYHQASGGFTGRVDGGYYYHTPPPGEDYSRYQQYNSMHLDRKY